MIDVRFNNDINFNTDPKSARLFDALYALMQTRPLDTLSVEEILEKAQVSRNSFYRRYRDKYDLLNSNHRKIQDKTFLSVGKGDSWREQTRVLYDTMYRHKRFYQNAFLSSAQNSLKAYIYQVSFAKFEEILRARGALQDWVSYARLQVYVYGTLELTVQWAMGGMKQPVEDFVKVSYASMPEALREYYLEMERTE